MSFFFFLSYCFVFCFITKIPLQAMNFKISDTFHCHNECSSIWMLQHFQAPFPVWDSSGGGVNICVRVCVTLSVWPSCVSRILLSLQEQTLSVFWAPVTQRRRLYTGKNLSLFWHILTSIYSVLSFSKIYCISYSVYFFKTCFYSMKDL